MSENKDTTISLPCLCIHLYLPQSNTMELNTFIFTVLTQINNIDFYLNMQRNMSLISGFPVFPVTSFFQVDDSTFLDSGRESLKILHKLSLYWNSFLSA